MPLPSPVDPSSSRTCNAFVQSLELTSAKFSGALGQEREELIPGGNREIEKDMIG